MDWTARLEGGPADGDAGCIDELPTKLWVIFCGNCDEKGEDPWHWFNKRRRGAEVYALQDSDARARTARYVYKDIDLDGLDQLDREAEKELAAA